MKLYLIRHTHALDRGSGEIKDPERYLIPKGRKLARRLGKKLAGMGVEFDGVFTSPYVRAVQTAERVVAGAGYKGVVEVLPELACGLWSEKTIARALEGRNLSGGYALVGHNPDMEEMADRLLGFSAGRAVFKKGTVGCVEIDGLPFEDKASLDWVLSPKSLRKIPSFG